MLKVLAYIVDVTDLLCVIFLSQVLSDLCEQ